MDESKPRLENIKKRECSEKGKTIKKEIRPIFLVLPAPRACLILNKNFIETESQLADEG